MNHMNSYTKVIGMNSYTYVFIYLNNKVEFMLYMKIYVNSK